MRLFADDEDPHGVTMSAMRSAIGAVPVMLFGSVCGFIIYYATKSKPFIRRSSHLSVHSFLHKGGRANMTDGYLEVPNAGC